MAKKIKVSPISEDASYTDVVDAAEQEEVVKEPVVEEGAQQPEQPSEQPTELIEPTPEPATETKPKKEVAKGTCENCGKTMTLKNLRYSHHLICPANNNKVESETVVEPIPEKPKLVRSVTIEPKHEEVEPVEVKPKVKRTINKVKVPKEPEVEKPVVLKKSKAVLKTEKYEALVKNAL